MQTATLNLLWSDQLMDGLAAAGVSRVVISPGSRSTPLVLAVNRHPALRSWHHPDERSAAFFALGLARHQLQPVALIATSGSAPAHWLPAVIEANRSGIPLILLSADRPPELQACGSNQTVDQIHLFGSQVRAFHDAGPATESPQAFAHIRRLGVQAVHEACGQNPGPVHINLPLREPLTPSDWPPIPTPGPAIPPVSHYSPPDPQQVGRIRDRITEGKGLIICGPATHEAGFADAVCGLANRLGCPLLADPLSGLRFGAHDHARVICRYDSFLRSPLFKDGSKPDWVLRFGAAPVSKTLQEYQSGASLLLCAPGGNWPDPSHQLSEMVRTDPTRLCNSLAGMDIPPGPSTWLQRFIQAERLCDEIQLPLEKEPFEYEIINDLVASLPDDAILFSGNSLPIRQLDSWSGQGSKPLRILANRGASGIDGNVSTLLGLAAAGDQPVIGLLGDLAFFHDMNGLLFTREVNATIIVFNNNGGGIFGTLPQARLSSFHQQWVMPTDLDFTHTARLYGLQHQRIEQSSEFIPALESAVSGSGVTLIEVMLDQARSLERQTRYFEMAMNASAGLAN